MRILIPIMIFLAVSCTTDPKNQPAKIQFLDHSVQVDAENNYQVNWITTTDTMFVEVYHSNDDQNFSIQNMLQKNKLGGAVIFSELKGQYLHLVIPENDTLVIQLQ